MLSSINRQLGSILLLIGIQVGAGALAIPIVISYVGFGIGCVLMLLTYLLMLFTTLQICECSLASPIDANLASMAKNLLGKFGRVVVWLNTLFILYVILVAYISAAGSTFDALFNISSTTAYLLFTFILGGVILIGTAAVDWLNRVLLIIKLLFLLFACALLISTVHIEYLMGLFPSTKYIFMTLPILVPSFVGHFMVPTLRIYLHSDYKSLARVVVISSTIVLCLYIIWILAILGVIPRHGQFGFDYIFAKGNLANVGDIIHLLKYHVKGDITSPLDIFMCVAVTTSFLGVGLSLLHFLVDALKLNRLPARSGNIVGGVLTFGLPLLIIFISSEVFLRAISYVGLCCNILLIIVPFFMVSRLSKSGHEFVYNIVGTRWVNYVALLLGLLISAAQIYFI